MWRIIFILWGWLVERPQSSNILDEDINYLKWKHSRFIPNATFRGHTRRRNDLRISVQVFSSGVGELSCRLLTLLSLFRTLVIEARAQVGISGNPPTLPLVSSYMVQVVLLSVDCAFIPYICPFIECLRVCHVLYNIEFFHQTEKTCQMSRSVPWADFQYFPSNGRIRV